MNFNNLKYPEIKQIKKKRKKQIAESLFSSAIKNTKGIIGHKLHNNPLAHQTTHCDFEIFNKYGDVFMIEVKEVNLTSKSKTFIFSRVTQKNALLYYSNFSLKIKSFVLLYFRNRLKEDSYWFLIDIKKWVSFTTSFHKKSAYLNEMLDHFKPFNINDLSYFTNPL